MNQSIIQTQQLQFSYPANEGENAPKTVLNGVDLSIERGSFTAVRECCSGPQRQR